jgi:hypothetical protein
MTHAPGARAGPFQHRFSGFGSSNPSEPHSSFSQPAAFNGLYPSVQAGETLANYLLSHSVIDFTSIRKSQSKVSQTSREETPCWISAISRLRDAMNRFCTSWLKAARNQEIAEQLNISPRTVKQHLRTLFLRAGIKDGRKRVKLRTTPRSTTNQAHRAGHLGPSAALSACIEHNSEYNFSSSTFVPQPRRNKKGGSE